MTDECTAVVLSRKQWQQIEQDLGKVQHSLILVGARTDAVMLNKMRRLARYAARVASDVSVL